MKADKYITKKIESFIEANHDAKMKYMYDTIFNMHVIEVASATLYESAEFKAWHDDLISEIARKYPMIPQISLCIFSRCCRSR